MKYAVFGIQMGTEIKSVFAYCFSEDRCKEVIQRYKKLDRFKFYSFTYEKVVNHD